MYAARGGQKMVSDLPELQMVGSQHVGARQRWVLSKSKKALVTSEPSLQPSLQMFLFRHLISSLFLASIAYPISSHLTLHNLVSFLFLKHNFHFACPECVCVCFALSFCHKRLLPSTWALVAVEMQHQQVGMVVGVFGRSGPPRDPFPTTSL